MSRGVLRSAVLMAAFVGGVLPAQPAPDSAQLQHSVRQLQESHGEWDVTTEFLNADGSVARRVQGTYRFDWVVEDRVLVGVSRIPELRTASGILFYVSPTRGVIEMVSVGPEGAAWTMTGPLGGETRETKAPEGSGAGDLRLRFTRYAVAPESFESRMEFSGDDGKTWLPGNHQLFRRRRSVDPGAG